MKNIFFTDPSNNEFPKKVDFSTNDSCIYFAQNAVSFKFVSFFQFAFFLRLV